MKEQAKIILTLPTRILSPNCPIASKRMRIAKAVATKKQRKEAKRAMEELQIDKWEKAELQAKFFFKTQRRRDALNYMSMLKGAIDGVVDAGLLVDDSYDYLTPLPPIFEIDKKNPRVELILTKTK